MLQPSDTTLTYKESLVFVCEETQKLESSPETFWTDFCLVVWVADSQGLLFWSSQVWNFGSRYFYIWHFDDVTGVVGSLCSGVIEEGDVS